jgi:hypothetical protein
MSQVLDSELQHCTMNAIVHAAQMAGLAVQEAAARYERPSAIFRPRLSIDGNQWCALYGDNVQDGVAGFGDSPASAMWDFDRNWTAALHGIVKEKTRCSACGYQHGHVIGCEYNPVDIELKRAAAEIGRAK